MPNLGGICMPLRLSSSNIGMQTIGYINVHINEELSIEKLTDNLYYNRTYLMKKFKKETGNTINEYINKKRIFESIEHLLSTDDKILKIALTNGFNSAEYYSEVFQKYIGCSPTAFKKILENGISCKEKVDIAKIHDNFNKLSQ